MLRDPCAVRDHVSSPSADAVFLHRLLLALFILFYGAPWIRIQAPFTLTTWLVGYELRFLSSCVTFSLSLIHAFVFHEARDIPSSLCPQWNHISAIRSNVRLSPTSVKISFDFFLLFVPSRRPPFLSTSLFLLHKLFAGFLRLIWSFFGTIKRRRERKATVTSEFLERCDYRGPRPWHFCRLIFNSFPVEFVLLRFL